MATKTKKDERLGWHLINSDLTLKYSDGRKVVVGTRLTAMNRGVEDPTMEIRVCSRGMHASTKITNAIGYHSGPWLSRVLVEGDISVDEVEWDRKDGAGYKFAGRHRTVLWMRRLDRKTLARITKELKLKVFASGAGRHKTVQDFVSAIASIRASRKDTRHQAEKMLTEWAFANGCPC